MPTLSVRDFLSWFGVQRRGGGIVAKIRDTLNKAEVRTEPDFESAYIDSSIGFILASPVNEKESPDVESGNAEVFSVNTTSYSDPTYRISKLEAANISPAAIPPDAERFFSNPSNAKRARG